MNWRRRACLLFLLTLFALLAHARPGNAFSRAIAVSGTSTSAGTCQIIIESFGAPEEGPSSLAPIVINVPIPNGSTASNSATLIRNAVDAALPADYVVTIPGAPNVVRIDRSPGTFTMVINNSVPGQTIVEVAVVPILGGLFGVVLAVILALGGSLLVIRRVPLRSS